MRSLWGGIIGLMILLATSGELAAASRTYNYSIEHGDYGAIGTYSDTIDQVGDQRRIDTKLRVAVKIIGITVYREDADRTEIWQGDRLVTFHSLTTVNGKPIAVDGAARPDGFSVTSPSGTVLGPARLYTSSPWSVTLPMPAMLLSTKSGRIEPAQVIDAGMTTETVLGRDLPVHHYEVLTGKRQDVWTDRNGVPVHFRTVESGAPVDFVLKSDSRAAVAERQP